MYLKTNEHSMYLNVNMSINVNSSTGDQHPNTANTLMAQP